MAQILDLNAERRNAEEAKGARKMKISHTRMILLDENRTYGKSET